MARVVLLVLLILGAGFPAAAERRVALVIGNSAYASAARLENPANDAVDMAQALRGLGFDVVSGVDLDGNAMRRAVRDFSDKLEGADVALFFYAGHAVQVGGQNYLAPIDTDLRKESDLDFETISLDLVRKQMERSAQTQIVFLDACRDNPLARGIVGRSRAIGQGKGLARFDSAVEGAFIAFATQPDNVALDGEGRNSPFTKALLRHIATPGVEISAMMTDVRREVFEVTKERQLPWTNSSLLGSFFFNPAPVEPSPQEKAQAERLARLAAEADAFEAVKNSKDVADFEAFLRDHGDSNYAPLARLAIQRLTPAPEPKPVAAAKVAPEPPAAPPEKSAAEKPAPEKSAAEKPAPEKPAPEKPAVVASLEPKPEAGARESVAASKEPAPAAPQAAGTEPAIEELSRQAVRQIQSELDRIGCDPGRPDGLWGDRSRSALGDYARHAKLDLASLEPSAELLEQLQARKQPVCPKAEPPKRASRPAARTADTIVRSRPARKTSRPSSRKSSGSCFRFNGQLVCE